MPEQRDENLEKVRLDGAFDVVVIGGGINGIGVFRELALQGLRVLLVERNDFCSGCSAAPSRMIHGGLRYLENGEFNLVRESLRERDALLANAAHLVRPLPTTIPITSIFSGMLNGAMNFLGLSARPASRGALPIKIGLMLYDWTTRQRRVLPAHSFRTAAATLKQWPDLSPDLHFSATYYDAWITYPERLGIELLLDTKRLAPDCVALNYAELVAEGSAFILKDRIGEEALSVSAKVIVNASGAWLDESIASLRASAKPADRFVSGTKGSHLVLDNPSLYDALRGHMIFFENFDGRVCIVFPYLGKVLAGSTDIRVEKVARVRCEPQERDYIIDALGRVFPSLAISADDIIFSYSGIRPLPRSDHAFTGRISRGHFVHRLDGPVPQFCMVGGKWTTFRAFAEQAADAVLAELGQPRKVGTLDLPIGGGDGYPNEPSGLQAEIARDFGVSSERAEWMVDLFGVRARNVLESARGRADDVPLASSCLMHEADIVYLVRNEFVEGLPDILLRRTPLCIRGDVTSDVIDSVASVLAGEFGWSAARMRREIEAFRTELADYHGVSREMLDKRSENRSRHAT